MKLQNIAHLGVPSQTLQLEYPKQYLPFASSTPPNEPLIAKLRTKITEIVKRKLRLNATFRPDGVKNLFEHQFSVKEGEKLLRASQCYISTTAGPILGFLFISTHKIAFCSENPITFASKGGQCIKIHYKVIIPVGKLSRANGSRNMKRPREKYIEIVTVDKFDFWFMGFRKYEETLKNLQQAKFKVYKMTESCIFL